MRCEAFQQAISRLIFKTLQARHDSVQEMNQSRSKHTPRFSHSPYIGSSSARPIEKNRDAFFGRLYDQFGERMDRSIAKQQADEHRRQTAIASSSFVAQKAGRAGGSRPMTADQTATHVSRCAVCQVVIYSVY